MKEKQNWKSLLPSAEIEVDETHLRNLFLTMQERQKIWVKRVLEKQERPWTDDIFMKDYKFTNVYRELDRNSQYEIENIIKTTPASDRFDRIWKVIFFRCYNSPPFIEFLKENTNWKNGIPGFYEFEGQSEILRDLTDRAQREGINPFTSSYLIMPTSLPKGTGRNNGFASYILPFIHSKIYELTNIMDFTENAYDVLKFMQTWLNVGGFTAHEFLVSLSYYGKYTDRPVMKFDENDFTNIGPGSSIGIRLIFPSTKTKDQLEKIKVLRDLAETKLNEIGGFDYLHFDKVKNEYYTDKNKSSLTLNQIEMWLCEYSKYWKMQINLGKQRGKYKPK